MHQRAKQHTHRYSHSLIQMEHWDSASDRLGGFLSLGRGIGVLTFLPPLPVVAVFSLFTSTLVVACNFWKDLDISANHFISEISKKTVRLQEQLDE